MVAVKGRLNPLTVTDTSKPDQKMRTSGQVKNLKVYAEDEKVKFPDSLNKVTKGKSIPHNACSSLLNVSDSKSGIKISEKIKTKPDKVGISVGRKALGDISNVKGTLSRTEQGKVSRLSNRCKTYLGNKERGSSDKPLMGRVRVEPTQATAEKKTITKPVNKSTKVASNESKTKFQGRNSLTAGGRMPVRIPLHLSRKSLPAIKQVSQVESSSMTKESSEKSEKSKGKHGFPVKSSVRKSNIPNPSNLSSRPWRNRVSDGFVVMASRAQNKIEPGVVSRKSVRPSVKITSTAVNYQRKSQPTQLFLTKKLSSSPVVLVKGKQNVSVTKDIPLDVLCKRKKKVSLDVSSVSLKEPASEEAICTDTSYIPSTSSNIIAKKSSRRNSYTSSLISKSKECSNVTPEKNLPNIYDERNHLEVSDYVDDIYYYYWVMEAQNFPLKNYMEIQRDLTSQMRGILINWLIEVHHKFDLMEETLFLTVSLLDRYLSLESIKRDEMQLVGLTALLLASKYEDFWHPRVTDLISISAESYTRHQMLQMEKTILKKLKFRLNEPTPYVFMLKILKAAQSNKKLDHLAFYLIELCLVESEALNYKPSLLCASAVYVARCTMQMTPAWTPLLAKHARYQESQIRGCAEMILKFHKAAKTSLLKVTYDKYVKQDRSRVSATMKPLDRLPV